ncbi:hypothetical protein N9W11_05785 [Psychrosphaera haliotis]|nr:hypothetical protein [Psychrosphaera haliotis]
MKLLSPNIAVFLLLFLTPNTAATAISTHSVMKKLNDALSELGEAVPVSGHVVVSFNKVEGDGKKSKEKSGQVALMVREDMNGLTTSYSTNVLKNMKQESAAKLKDEDASTPTIDAINDFSMSNINNLLSPIDSLNQLLKSATLTRVENLKEQVEGASKLHFTLPVEAIITNKRTREYVDKFDGEMTLTVKADGTPIELLANYNGSGRAYVVFSVKAAGTRLQRFDVVGNRLVMTMRESFSSYDSTFGKGENSEVHLFTPKVVGLPNKDHFTNTSKDTSI